MLLQLLRISHNVTPNNFLTRTNVNKTINKENWQIRRTGRLKKPKTSFCMQNVSINRKIHKITTGQSMAV